MATSAQIISFGAWRSPTPANTIEGKFYLQRKSSLSVGKRRLLRTMEDDLFSRSALCTDMAGVLERPERLHEIPGLGIIAYFWSRCDQLYVLSEFHFEDSDAGGGLPCGSRSPSGPCTGRAKPAPRRIAAAARAIAQGAIRIIDSVAADLRWHFGTFALTTFASSKLVTCSRLIMSRPRVPVARLSSSVELASEVLAVHALLAGTGPIDRDELPHWSLLREMITVPEELRNPLARSLMAGELICRLGSAADETLRAASHHGWRALLTGANADWPVPLHWQRHEDPIQLGALITAWLSDDGDQSVGGDTLRLLARARLSLVLASHVRRAATEASSLQTCPDAIAIAPAKHLLLRKIHLVSEYALLSYSVWPADHRWCGWDDDAGDDDARTLFKEFDRSVEIIAKQMDRAGRAASGQGTLRDRISTIAMEIVAPTATS